MQNEETMQSVKVREAARILDVSPQTLLRKVRQGLIKGFRLPGSTHVRIPVSEIKRLTEAELSPVEPHQESIDALKRWRKAKKESGK